jgi:hypothetical protein
MIKALERKSYSASLSAGIIVLLSVAVLLLIVAIATAFLRQDGQSFIPIFVMSLVAGTAGLFGTMFWYVTKARNFMRDESIEYDLTHPGFFDYYEQWRAKVDEITLNSNNF